MKTVGICREHRSIKCKVNREDNPSKVLPWIKCIIWKNYHVLESRVRWCVRMVHLGAMQHDYMETATGIPNVRYPFLKLPKNLE